MSSLPLLHEFAKPVFQFWNLFQIIMDGAQNVFQARGACGLLINPSQAIVFGIGYRVLEFQRLARCRQSFFKL